MKKIIIAFLIFSGIVSILSAGMTKDKRGKIIYKCYGYNKEACQMLIDDIGLSVDEHLETCGKNKECSLFGHVYNVIGDIYSAIDFYKKAIEIGDEKALINLGYLYRDHENDDAIELFELAAKSSNKKIKSEGLFALADLHWKGEMVAKDYEEAVKYYKQSCELSLSDKITPTSAVGCFMVGLYYDEDMYFNKNIPLAKKYYKKSCDLGNGAGCSGYKDLIKSK